MARGATNVRLPREATVTRQSKTRGCLWRALALGFVAGLMIVAANVADAVDLPRPLEQAIGRWVFFGVALAGAWIFLRTARRHEVPGGEAAMESDPRAPVLYLRPFAQDEEAARLYGATTEEEQLAEVLDAVGPVVAIGRPGEALPELGAARLYVGDRDWQRKIQGLLDQASLVVIRLGSTRACAWELEQARSRVPLAKLLLLVPQGPDDPRALLREAEARLRTSLPDAVPAGARLGSLAAIVAFDASGRSRLLPLRSTFWRTRATRRLAAPLALTLRPVLERHAGAWRAPPLNPLRVGVFLLLGLWLVAMAVLAVAAATGAIDLR